MAEVAIITARSPTTPLRSHAVRDQRIEPRYCRRQPSRGTLAETFAARVPCGAARRGPRRARALSMAMQRPISGEPCELDRVGDSHGYLLFCSSLPRRIIASPIMWNIWLRSSII